MVKRLCARAGARKRSGRFTPAQRIGRQPVRCFADVGNGVDVRDAFARGRVVFQHLNEDGVTFLFGLGKCAGGGGQEIHPVLRIQRRHHVGVDGLIGNLLGDLIAQLLGCFLGNYLVLFFIDDRLGEFLFLSAGGGQGLLHLRLGFRGGDHFGLGCLNAF